MTREGQTKRATIHDVARTAGVSAATVSKVLRGVTSVKADNIARVQKAVSELDYRIDPLAAGLRTERRRIIGAVVPDLESPFFGALVTGLESAFEAAGYHLIIASSRENEAREADIVTRMNDWRVDGVVLVPVRSQRGPGTEKLRDLGMHAVLVDRVSADDQFDTVVADNYTASAAVAEYLINAGHKHILLHGAMRISKAIRTRVEGFTARARELQPDIRIDTLLSDKGIEDQRSSLDAYFETHKDETSPTAVFSLSQYSTLLVLSELRRRAIPIPEEMALISFDDADWMSTTWPSITAVEQPVTAIAEAAVAALLARIEGRNSGFPVQHLEACTMLVRQSVKPNTLSSSGGAPR